MKNLIKFVKLFFVIVIFSCCKKERIKTYPITSLTTVNSVVDGSDLRVGGETKTIPNNSFAHLSMLSGSKDLYVWPVSDSIHPYFFYPKFVTQEAEVYSLFICGQVGNTEGILIKEDIPYRKDSTVGIRFINLSPNSTPLNITLSTSPTVNEVSNLAYKQYTDFKTYSSQSNDSYTFEVRDASTASPAPPLATFSLIDFMMPRFSNITLVIVGLVDSSPALEVTRVDNDR